MTTVFDVPADLLIKKVAENLKMSTGGIPDVHLSSEECTWTDL